MIVVHPRCIVLSPKTYTATMTFVQQGKTYHSTSTASGWTVLAARPWPRTSSPVLAADPLGPISVLAASRRSACLAPSLDIFCFLDRSCLRRLWVLVLRWRLARLCPACRSTRRVEEHIRQHCAGSCSLGCGVIFCRSGCSSRSGVIVLLLFAAGLGLCSLTALLAVRRLRL